MVRVTQHPGNSKILHVYAQLLWVAGGTVSFGLDNGQGQPGAHDIATIDKPLLCTNDSGNTITNCSAARGTEGMLLFELGTVMQVENTKALYSCTGLFPADRFSLRVDNRRLAKAGR